MFFRYPQPSCINPPSVSHPPPGGNLQRPVRGDVAPSVQLSVGERARESAASRGPWRRMATAPLHGKLWKVMAKSMEKSKGHRATAVELPSGKHTKNYGKIHHL